MTNNPYALLRLWLAEAETYEPNDPNAMALATVGKDGMPAVRMVLLKGLDERGLVFYTNLHSRKAVEIAHHAQASVCLHWKSLRRQVRCEGQCERVSDAEADAYFASRGRISQLGAWASLQSEKLPSRGTLEQRLAAVTAQYQGQSVPRPPHWHGTRIVPRAFEFWQDGAHRLHERTIFERSHPTQPWQIFQLYP